MDLIEDFKTRDPRRLEIPIKIKGVDHVVIARENNDGEAICYVYCLSKKHNDETKTKGVWHYSEVKLEDGATEMVLGLLNIGNLKVRVHVLEAVWHAAQRVANEQATFLQMS